MFLIKDALKFGVKEHFPKKFKLRGKERFCKLENDKFPHFEELVNVNM
jgi:hypothetical protein